MTKFCIFLDPTRTFSALTPERGKISQFNSIKNTGSPRTVALHLCQFRRTLAYKPLRSRRRFTIFFKLRFLAYISGAAEQTFAKLLPMVDLGCVQIPQYLGSCDVFPKLHGGPKKCRNFAYFRSPLLSRPNAAEYCNSKMKLLSAHGCSTRVPSLVNFGLQTPENEAL